jgi:hypothetical protein
MDMTPEEREKFQQEWGHRCGRFDDAGRRSDDGGRGYAGSRHGESRQPFPDEKASPSE